MSPVVPGPTERASPNGQRRRLGLGMVAGLGVVLVLVIVGALIIGPAFIDPAEREERRAAAWLARQPTQIPGRLISSDEVTAPGLARVLIRQDSGWLPVHRWLWDTLPKELRTAVALPRPRDSRWNGIFARAWLERHQERNRALPVLLAAATDPTRANRAAVMYCIEEFGTLDTWIGREMRVRPVDEGLAGLQDPNPEVRLQMLKRFAAGWPEDPTLRRRIDELQREVRGREILVTPPVNRGTVPGN